MLAASTHRAKGRKSMARNQRPRCATNCTIPRRHLDDCNDDKCRGCLPGLAADGLMLCQHHADRIPSDAQKAAEIYDAVLDRLSGGSHEEHEKTSGGEKGVGLSLSPAAVEVRDSIRATLVSWCRLIAEERGFNLPANDVTAMGAYVARSGQWLAAHPAAADASSELAELVSRAHPVAYPAGVRVIEIGPCPHDECAGMVKARMRAADSLLPSELVCSEDKEHTWPPSEWRVFGRTVKAQASREDEIVDTNTLAARLGCAPQWVRKLVSEDVLAPIERRSRGRGQPSMWFDLPASEAAYARHAARTGRSA